MFSNKNRLLNAIKKGFKKTNQTLKANLQNLLLGSPEINDTLKEELISILIQADISYSVALSIIEQAITETQRTKLNSSKALISNIQSIVETKLNHCKKNDDQLQAWISSEEKTRILLFIGVNGVGKTTSIGKIGNQLKEAKQSILFIAGDTYRAAAIEQIQTWAQRNQSPCISKHQGADSASVIFDGIESGLAKEVNFILTDTAGRLQDKDHLMKELEKIYRITQKFDAPVEPILVVDGTMGQNVLSQVEQFNDIIPLSGLICTKLDSSSKGGILISISEKFKIPIYFIGLGESISDLAPFDPKLITSELFTLDNIQ